MVNWDALRGKNHRRTDKELRCPMMCEECGKNYADPPERICVGCEAYKEHQK